MGDEDGELRRAWRGRRESGIVRAMGSDTIDQNPAETKTYASVAPKAQREILVHAVLAGLTPLIPVPFVDDWARNGIQTRMVRRIAKAHDAGLYDADARTLGRETGRDESLLFSATKKLAFYPIKRIFRKALFVLVLRDIVDISSRTYHVGYLLDYAFGQAWLAKSPPDTLRSAVDEVCRQADTSPVHRAFMTVFEESRDLLGTALQSARTWMGGAPGQEDGGPKDEERPSEVEALADRLLRAVNILPPEHFEKLRADLEKALGAHTP